ncbi:MAG: GAF domain-containing protein [Chitinophagales bacterium]|nr:GAF domain-containing protein [Chitinophagales bacterium]
MHEYIATKDYGLIYQQIESICIGEEDLIANLSNIVALLKEQLQYHWIGFYFVKNDTLVLGPFQGPVACTRIGFGKGVCGKSWKEKKTIIVPDVHQFEGHIACSSLSNSEIVVPIIKNDEVQMILDIDSVEFNTFDERDQMGLEKIASFIATICS